MQQQTAHLAGDHSISGLAVAAPAGRRDRRGSERTSDFGPRTSGHSFEPKRRNATIHGLTPLLYLAAGVVGPASLLDAHHVAIATVARADMIVSWNFKHIVHHEKMAGFNAVNLREGYPPLRIFSPLEVV